MYCGIQYRALYIFNTCIQYDLGQVGYAAKKILFCIYFRHKESKNAYTIDYEFLPNISCIIVIIFVPRVRWRRPGRARITPPRLLSRPCVSDLLRSKRPKAGTRCYPRWLDNPNSGYVRITSVAVCNLYCVRVIIVRLNKRSKPRSFEHN